MIRGFRCMKLGEQSLPISIRANLRSKLGKAFVAVKSKQGHSVAINLIPRAAFGKARVVT